MFVRHEQVTGFMARSDCILIVRCEQVAGFMEPLPPNADGSPAKGFEFENQIVGSAIPSGFIPSVEKGFKEASASGAIVGYPCEVRCACCACCAWVTCLLREASASGAVVGYPCEVYCACCARCVCYARSEKGSMLVVNRN